jgi:hypothetical protein
MMVASRILEQSGQAAEVARQAFDAGDVVTGIAAIQLAAQLIKLARLLEREGMLWKTNGSN